MRKISVNLGESAERALNAMLVKYDCSISDIVNIAILSIEREGTTIIANDSPVEVFRRRVRDSRWSTIENWCEYRAITKRVLYYYLRNAAEGRATVGFGNLKNKWRDKYDDRVFKTHTSWVAHCIKEDFNIDYYTRVS